MAERYISAHTHTHSHVGRKTKSSISFTNKHTGCKQKLFFFIKEYKSAPPQCVVEKLYGVTTALEITTTRHT